MMTVFVKQPRMVMEYDCISELAYSRIYVALVQFLHSVESKNWTLKQQLEVFMNVANKNLKNKFLIPFLRQFFHVDDIQKNALPYLQQLQNFMGSNQAAFVSIQNQQSQQASPEYRFMTEERPQPRSIKAVVHADGYKYEPDVVRQQLKRLNALNASKAEVHEKLKIMNQRLQVFAQRHQLVSSGHWDGDNYAEEEPDSKLQQQMIIQKARIEEQRRKLAQQQDENKVLLKEIQRQKDEQLRHRPEFRTKSLVELANEAAKAQAQKRAAELYAQQDQVESAPNQQRKPRRTKHRQETESSSQHREKFQLDDIQNDFDAEVQKHQNELQPSPLNHNKDLQEFVSSPQQNAGEPDFADLPTTIATLTKRMQKLRRQRHGFKKFAPRCDELTYQVLYKRHQLLIHKAKLLEIRIHQLKSTQQPELDVLQFTQLTWTYQDIQSKPHDAGTYIAAITQPPKQSSFYSFQTVQEVLMALLEANKKEKDTVQYFTVLMRNVGDIIGSAEFAREVLQINAIDSRAYQIGVRFFLQQKWDVGVEIVATNFVITHLNIDLRFKKGKVPKNARKVFTIDSAGEMACDMLYLVVVILICVSGFEVDDQQEPIDGFPALKYFE